MSSSLHQSVQLTLEVFLQSGDSFLNGDGMIYRLDFKGKSEVRLKTRIVKPPDYYADKATWSFKSMLTTDSAIMV
jgi:carotenoid cleavage dioxygenase-like enzyme